MSAPRINTALLSAETRANLEKVHAQFPFVNSNEGAKLNQEELGTKQKKHRNKKKTLTPDMADGLVRAVKVSEDGNEVKIVMALDPSTTRTAQQKGVFVGKDGRVHFFTKADIAKAEKTLRLALSPYAHLSRDWGEVPIEVIFDYFFSYPSGTPKRDRHIIGPMNSRPDASNITKGICDAMTEAGFWSDDSFINTETSRKRRTNGPACTNITIKNLQPKFEEFYAELEEQYSPTLFRQSQNIVQDENNPLSELITSEEKQ